MNRPLAKSLRRFIAGIVRFRVAIALLLVGVHVGLVAWAAAFQFPTIDEMGHLPAGVAHWKYGNFRPYHVNPPLTRLVAALPMLVVQPQIKWEYVSTGIRSRPAFGVGQKWIQEAGFENTMHCFMLARWACLPFTILGAWACYRLAADIFGPLAGLAALSMWCFSPNILANASLITPDLAASATGITAVVFFRYWLRSGSYYRAMIAGVWLGAALLTKSTWVLLVPLWFVFAAAKCLQGRRCDKKSALPQMLQLLALYLIALYVVNLGYGFEGSFKLLKDFSFVSHTLTGEAELDWDGAGNRFQDGALGYLPVPIPENYLQGMDYVKWEFERGYPSYLRGEWKHGGWWYYYLYAMLVKMPIGFLALIAGSLLGMTLALFHCQQGWTFPCKGRDALLLVLPACGVLALVSSQTGFNHHIRYVLPAFPCLFVLAGGSVANWSKAGVLRLLFASLMLCWATFSSLIVYPYSHSYFNELAGGPLKGNQHLHDSNVDWGQEIYRLKLWLDDHQEIDQLGVAPYQWVDLHKLGMRSYDAPRCPPYGEKSSWTLEDGPQPGWFAISCNHLIGEPSGSNWDKTSADYLDDPSRSYFTRFEPFDRIGYSILIYHISLEQANEVRSDYGLPLLPEE